jgi:hypothetical protein
MAVLTVKKVSATVNQASATIKINCWEFKKCGRQPGGHKEKELGT